MTPGEEFAEGLAKVLAVPETIRISGGLVRWEQTARCGDEQWTAVPCAVYESEVAAPHWLLIARSHRPAVWGGGIIEPVEDGTEWRGYSFGPKNWLKGPGQNGFGASISFWALICDRYEQLPNGKARICYANQDPPKR